MLKDFEVIEYFIDNDNNITGWYLQAKIKRPDLINVPAPTKDMSENLRDEHGNLKYKLVDNKIVENKPVLTESQLSKKEVNTMDKIEVYKILCAGILDKNDLAFQELLVKLSKV